MIEFTQKGNFNKTTNFFDRIITGRFLSNLQRYGQEGVEALASATPVDSGETANSWRYEVKLDKKSYTITWFNSHVEDKIPIAILIQYGHGTRNGGYVQGRDFINPAIQPIFDKIAEEAWKEVTR